MARSLSVGIIGTSLQRGWAKAVLKSPRRLPVSELCRRWEGLRWIEASPTSVRWCGPAIGGAHLELPLAGFCVPDRHHRVGKDCGQRRQVAKIALGALDHVLALQFGIELAQGTLRPFSVLVFSSA